MAFLWNLFGAVWPKKPTPPLFATDVVAPLHVFDDINNLREISLFWTLKFDDILDANLLADSLSQLFEMDGWRKLGGRLRLRSDGRAEVHVPQEFTKERPAIHFTKEEYGVSMREHPMASQLPAASSGPALYPGARAFSSLALGPGVPRTIEEFFTSDHPQFSLHVVTFTDGTLVTVYHNHVTTDMGGLLAIFNAWQLVLAGKSDQVAPFMSYSEDPMALLYKADNVPKYVLADSLLEGWKLAVWALRHIFELWFSPLESHMACIPKKNIEAFILECKNHVATLPGEAFVSEGDILTALAARLVAEGLPTGSTRNVMTLMAVNPRSRIESIFKKNAAYVQNAAVAAFFSCSAKELLEQPVSEAALKSRQAIISQCTEEQMKALTVVGYESLTKTGNPPLLGDASMALLVTSNWSQAGFMNNIDFSPAISKASQKFEQRSSKPGHPAYYHAESIIPGKFTINLMTIMGRDWDGNLWINGTFHRSAWTKFLDIFRASA